MKPHNSGVIALICARAGSKGVPGKNIKTIAGKPLIVHTIEQVRALEAVKRIIISTDSKEIADVAKNAGAEVPFLRPADLARDDSPEWSVWQHALNWLKERGEPLPYALLVCPTTSPLRKVSDLERCLASFDNDRVDIVITVTSAHRNPYFNMVTIDRDGFAKLVISAGAKVIRRQDAPAVFDMTTVAYVADPNFVLSAKAIFDGRVGHITIPPERALDIDTPLDFEVAEYLMSKAG